MYYTSTIAGVMLMLLLLLMMVPMQMLLLLYSAYSSSIATSFPVSVIKLQLSTEQVTRQQICVYNRTLLHTSTQLHAIQSLKFNQSTERELVREMLITAICVFFVPAIKAFLKFQDFRQGFCCESSHLFLSPAKYLCCSSLQKSRGTIYAL